MSRQNFIYERVATGSRNIFSFLMNIFVFFIVQHRIGIFHHSWEVVALIFRSFIRLPEDDLLERQMEDEILSTGKFFGTGTSL